MIGERRIAPMLSLFKRKNTQTSQQETSYCTTIQKQLDGLTLELSQLKKLADGEQQTDIEKLIATYLPLIEALKLTYQSIDHAASTLNGALLTQRQPYRFSPKTAFKKLAKIEKSLARLTDSQPTFFWQKWRLAYLKKKQQRIIQNLAAFDQTKHGVPSIFHEIETLQALVTEGMGQLRRNPSERQHNRAWMNQLDYHQVNHIWAQWQQLKEDLPTTQLTLTQLETYTQQEPIIFYQLYYKDGWDFTAIKAFNHYLISQLTVQFPDSPAEQIASLLADSRKIGSATYHILFKNSSYPATEKITLLLDQLGAEIDTHGMLQLTGPFMIDPNMPPHSLFIESFCQVVQIAYFERTLDSKKIHQLRMYFDHQNIHYIRRVFPAKTDADSLRKYIATPFPKGLNQQPLLRERARFHNKVPKGMDFVSYQKESPNIKRLTPNFHSEFILDKHGRFVSQWNVLKTANGRVVSNPKAYQWTESFEQQLLNTESLNYGKKNNAEHKRLDSIPPIYYDHDLRNIASKNWVSPSQGDYSFRKTDSRSQHQL